MASLADTGRCSCPQRASAHPHQAGVLLRKLWLLLSSATTSAQRAVKFTQEKVPVQQTVKLMGFRAQKSLLDVTWCGFVCTTSQRLPHSDYCVRPCDSSWTRAHLSRKSLSQFKEHNWQRSLLLQAAALKNLQGPFGGHAREDYPPDSIPRNMHWMVPGVPWLRL